MSDQEVQRLQEVYGDYEARDLSGTRWGTQNRGNRAIMSERHRVMRGMLDRHGLLPLGDREILEVGCGSGHVLAGLEELGATPRAVARRRSPAGTCRRGAHVESGAGHSPGERREPPVRRGIVRPRPAVHRVLVDPRPGDATERRRGMRPRLAAGGHVLWYDFRYDNPSNKHVRGVRRSDVDRLFPGFSLSLRTLTVVPQVARRLGPLTELATPCSPPSRRCGRTTWGCSGSL